MARKPDIQYIQFYTDGSAARQPVPRPPKKRKPAARIRPQRQKRITIQVDPVAVCGILVATVMLVLMAVGMVQLDAAQRQQEEMENYISSLREQNAQLQADYTSGYDLEAVKDAALSLGMVPAEQIQKIPIQVTVPQVEELPTLWERISAFFTELFA